MCDTGDEETVPFRAHKLNVYAPGPGVECVREESSRYLSRIKVDRPSLFMCGVQYSQLCDHFSRILKQGRESRRPARSFLPRHEVQRVTQSWRWDRSQRVLGLVVRIDEAAPATLFINPSVVPDLSKYKDLSRPFCSGRYRCCSPCSSQKAQRRRCLSIEQVPRSPGLTSICTSSSKSSSSTTARTRACTPYHVRCRRTLYWC